MFMLIFLTCFYIVPCLSSSYHDRFEEKLLIKPLPSGLVYTEFKFITQKDLEHGKDSSYHFRLFPRSLGETLHEYQVRELHFSLTQGLWRYERWGYPERGAPPGAELWAMFGGNVSEVTSNWKQLTNVLSGQFCASLNFIDETNTVIPKLSFKPEGVVKDGSYDRNFIRYATLPRETVCTENLTPFKKLLPCGAQAGLSTLLNALKMFSAHYVSLAVDVKTVCKGHPFCSNVALELVQTITVVFDPTVKQNMKQDWSFVKLFGTSLTSTCPVAEKSRVFVEYSTNKTGVPFHLTPTPTEINFPSDGPEIEARFAVYDLKEMLKTSRLVNVAASYKSHHVYGIVPSPMFYSERKLIGYGQEQGGIQCTFVNNHPTDALKIFYFDLVPWYLRLYSHTLVVKNGDQIISPDYFHYQPAKDRSRPHHLELVLSIPARSKAEMSVEFDFAFLKWTEYPPDANHGFYVGSAVVSFLHEDVLRNSSLFLQPDDRDEERHFVRVYTQMLLVSLPTPDFSMPYNVICLTCTVVALAFGPIHNITTKSLRPLDQDEQKNGILSKVKKWWSSKKDTNTSSTDDSVSETLQTTEEESESKKSQ